MRRNGAGAHYRLLSGRTAYDVARVASYLNRLRNRHFFALDLLILLVTPFVALSLRTDYPSAIQYYWPELLVYLAYAVPLRLLIFRAFGLYQRYWRYASVEELGQLTLMNLVATLAIVALFYGLRLPFLSICSALPAACGLPRSIPVLDSILVFLCVSGVRFAVRSSAVLRRKGRGAPPQGSSASSSSARATPAP